MRQKLHHLPLYHRRPYKLYLFCHWGNKNHSWSKLKWPKNKNIYMIHCLRCDKQYIGETKRRLKVCFNEHQRPVDRPTPSFRLTAVSDHFLSDNHSPNDIELIPLLELIHSSRDALRRAREAYLI